MDNGVGITITISVLTEAQLPVGTLKHKSGVNTIDDVLGVILTISVLTGDQLLVKG
jgi:hypothetical protein